jgi:outer membrane receptor protein involved in Fe transport
VGAKVTLSIQGSNTLTTITDAGGNFRFDAVSTADGEIFVTATGFASFRGDWNGSRIDITLEPAAISAQVTVTRGDARLGDTPQSVVMLSSREIGSNPAATVDDKLRQVPGFTLFRRSGSRTANPTSQGVSLRGTGGSGASRAAVVLDDIPLNDPFGGWVYWGRIPIESVESVEVLRGSAGEVFGSSAIGGIVDIRTKVDELGPLLDLETSYGSQKTPLASMFTAAPLGRMILSLAAEAFATDGFVAVPADQRGMVDKLSGVKRTSLMPRVSYKFNNSIEFFTAIEYFEERRTNGTLLQNNDTKIASLAVGADITTRNFGDIAFRSWVLSEHYHQSFSSIAADRNSETLTRLQTVPSGAAGASLTISRSWSSKGTFVAGAEVRDVEGSSDETALVAGRPTSLVNNGGRELTIGGFAGIFYNATPQLVVSGGLRFDHWREYSAYSDTRPLTGTLITRSPIADRSASAVNPRVSALYRLSSAVSITGSFSTGFRQPTLNELYRSFRVGNVLTLANQDLGAERARTGEAGIIANGFGDRLYARAVVFCTEITQPVANVTLSSTPSLITRQRKNLGSTRSCGVEADSQMRLRHDLEFSTGYLFVDARVKSFPADRTLEGLRVPQVARNQFTASTRYTNPKIAAINVQLRAASPQFDDDQNQFRLAGFGAIDLYASRRLSRFLDVFFAAENIFNDRIDAGRTPVVALTGLRTVRAGIKLTLRKR